MTDPVKATRRYDSSRRRRQAADTRREILDAARRLFERQGYASTTMAAIAAEAGVSRKTVYLAFETKSGLLRALWNLLLRGDEDEVPMPERDWYREVLAEPRPDRQLRLTAHGSRLVKLRVGTMFEVIRAAAATDPDTAALWGRIQTQFHSLLRAVVQSIADKGALAPDLDVDRATDVLWSVSHPSLWQLLVVERDWTPESYEDWCAETTCAQLLRASRGRRAL
jgi:AcrR family transcriptional regulator